MESESAYAVYLQSITEELLGLPNDGFKIRLYITLSLTVYYTLLTAILFALVVEASRTRNGGTGLWLWRRVYLETKAPSGSQRYLIVTNTRVALFGCIGCAGFYFIVYLVHGIRCYVRQQSAFWEFPIRAFLPHCVCTAGWLITFGNTQVVLIMHHDKDLQLRYAKWINRTYVGGGVFFLILVTVEAIVSMLAGIRYWHRFVEFLAFLRSRIAANTGTILPAELDILNAQAQRFAHARDGYGVFAPMEYGTLPGFAAVILLVNLSTIFLARLLKTQINRRVETLKFFKSPHSGSHSDPPQITLDRVQLSSGNVVGEEIKMAQMKNDSSTDAEDTTPSPMISRAAACMSRNEIRQIAVHPRRMRTTNPGVEEEQTSIDDIDRANALQILELQSTKLYVMVVGILVASAASISMGVAIYVTQTFVSAMFFNNFLRFEITIYSFPWACASCFAPVFTIMLYLQIQQRALWKAKKSSRIEISQTVRVDVEDP